MRRWTKAAGLAAALLGLAGPVGAQMRGHGGPVRALAVAPDGRVVVSGSFDQSAILWSLDEGSALAVLRFHEGAVNAVAALGVRRFATAGEDGRIAIWREGEPAKPAAVLEGHQGPIVALAVALDGRLASASWDGTARIATLDGRPARVLEGHHGNVNGVAFLADGRLATAGYDGTLRLWPAEAEAPPQVIRLSAPLNGVCAGADGEVVVAGADGVVRILSPTGQVRATVETEPRPVIALALSPDGTRIAAGSVGGAVAVIDRATARILFRLVGPGMPIWSLAFRPDGSELVTGGSDRLIRRWDMRTGEPVGPVDVGRGPSGDAAVTAAIAAGDRGAEVFQACVACHTLTPDDGNRAGPTLHGLFGRRIATLPGYNFSEPLKRLDIVWTPETVSRLFEIGPSHYTPGTKMPEQTIGRAEDRAALVRFLERATKP